MDETRLAIAFTAGMLATVNPCGLPMLPAYLTWFISGDDRDGGVGPAGGGEVEGSRARSATFAAVTKAVLVSATVAAGFMAVFAAAGAIATGLSFSVERVTPWLTVVIGIALVGVGVALLAGWHPVVALPTLDRGGRGRGLGSMFVFGVSYAIASVSCTLPVFVSQVSSTFGQSVGTGLAVFAAYALGMAVVLTALSVSVALARRSLVVALKQALRYVTRAAGALLVITGAYIAWYGLYEIRIESVTGDDPAIDRVTGWSAELASVVDRIGGVRLGLILALVVALVLIVGYAVSSVSSAKRATSSSSSSP